LVTAAGDHHQRAGGGGALADPGASVVLATILLPISANVSLPALIPQGENPAIFTEPDLTCCETIHPPLFRILWAKHPWGFKSPLSHQLRARIVLRCATGRTNLEVTDALGGTMQMVGKWRARFVDGRLDGLRDEPRPGAPRQIADAASERFVAQTLERTPAAATHRSVRTMAKASGLSPTTIHRIWQAFGLPPHRTETFKLSTDPLFIEKVRDIVGLYLLRRRSRWSCASTRRHRSKRWTARSRLPLRPGYAARRTHDYRRHGTSSLFAALDVATGMVIGHCRETRSSSSGVPCHSSSCAGAAFASQIRSAPTVNRLRCAGLLSRLWPPIDRRRSAKAHSMRGEVP
jgi:hypothetical protein